MKLIVLTPVSSTEVLTMSSLEMVSYINSTRKAGEAEVRHADFLSKVPRVLNGVERNFSSYYTASNGKQNPMYNFPKREAMLMAMSYSYELQAQVFDAWETAEAALIKTVVKPVALIPNFDNPIEAAEAWILEKKANILLTNEIATASPKVAFHDAVVNDGSTFSLAEVAKIIGVPPRKFNQMLRDGGYLMGNNVAYQHYIVLEILTLQYSGFQLADGSLARPTTRVTSKGVTHMQKKFGKAKVAA